MRRRVAGLAVVALAVVAVLVVRPWAAPSADHDAMGLASSVPSEEDPVALAVRGLARSRSSPAAAADLPLLVPEIVRREETLPDPRDAVTVPFATTPPGGFGVEVVVRGDEGEPAAGVPVRMTTRASGDWDGASWVTQTDREGVARFGPIGAPRVPRRRAEGAQLRIDSPIDAGVGIWDATEVYPEHLAGEFDSLTRIEGGARWITVFAKARVRLRVTGTVVRADGTPAQGISVRLAGGERLDDGRRDSRVTDQGGRFSTAVPQGGRTTVRLESFGGYGGDFVLVHAALDVPPTGLLDARFWLPAVTTLGGSILDAQGTPVSGVDLNLSTRSDVGEREHHTLVTTSDAAGRYAFFVRGIDLTEYELRVQRESGPDVVLVAAIAGPRADLDVTVPRHGFVVSTVDDETGVPVFADVHVRQDERRAVRLRRDPRHHGASGDEGVDRRAGARL